VKADYIDCKTCGGRVKIRSKRGGDGWEMIANCHRMWFVEITDARPTAKQALQFMIKAAHIPKDALTTNDWHPQTPEQIEAEARAEALRDTVADS
jgi:hypothetical protein